MKVSECWEVLTFGRMKLLKQEKLDEKVPDDLATKIDGKTYTKEIREASYFLQDVGVSQRNVSKTLRAVVRSVNVPPTLQ